MVFLEQDEVAALQSWHVNLFVTFGNLCNSVDIDPPVFPSPSSSIVGSTGRMFWRFLDFQLVMYLRIPVSNESVVPDYLGCISFLDDIIVHRFPSTLLL